MRTVSIYQVPRDATLAEPLSGPAGLPLLNSGVELTDDFCRQLADRGVKSIRIGDPTTDDIQSPGLISAALRQRLNQRMGRAFGQITEDSERFRDGYRAVSRKELTAEAFAETIALTMGSLNLDHLTDDIDQVLAELGGKPIVQGLNALRTHDSYTFEHSIDMTLLSLSLGRALEWDKRRLLAFGVGCLLHDLGKLFIDPAVLNKRSGLSPDEQRQIRAHTVVGYELVKQIAGEFSVLAAHVAFQHHEKQDGTGYPRRLKGNNRLGQNTRKAIHDFGSVAACADVYDAMVSERPYRAAWSASRTLAMIRQSAGTHFNSEAVRVMLQTVPPFPVLSEIRVTNGPHAGWSGVVSAIHRTPIDRPVVRLLKRPDGAETPPIEIDLAEMPEVIVQAIEPAEALADRAA